MSYREHKRHHHAGLEKEIERVVNRELKKEVELKGYNRAAVAVNLVNTGVFIDLSEIERNDPSATDYPWERIGDVIQAKTLRMRLQLQGQANTSAQTTWKDGCSLIRYIVFTWLPWEANSDVQTNIPNKILDLAQGPGAGLEILAPHTRQGVGAQYKIHIDETVSLSPSAGATVWAGANPILYQVRNFSL